MMDSTKLPLRTWFLAILLISQAKTGLSALALKRQLGTSYRTAWLIHHKVMTTMAQRDSEVPLTGPVQVDDAYLGGERPGVGGRGSPNKVPIVAAVSTDDAGHPMRVKLSRLAGFTCEAITTWARANIVVGTRKPRELPQFTWVNTVLGNLKTMINGAHKSFKFGKYANQYLGAFAYRFNQRFNLHALLDNLLGHAAATAPTRERQIRAVAEVHD